MKAVLVIDMPKYCFECQLAVDGWCYGTIDSGIRPSWCPLKEMPQKKDVYHLRRNVLSDYEVGYGEGWNACIEEIEK